MGRGAKLRAQCWPGGMHAPIRWSSRFELGRPRTTSLSLSDLCATVGQQRRHPGLAADRRPHPHLCVWHRRLVLSPHAKGAFAEVQTQYPPASVLNAPPRALRPAEAVRGGGGGAIHINTQALPSSAGSTRRRGPCCSAAPVTVWPKACSDSPVEAALFEWTTHHTDACFYSRC